MLGGLTILRFPPKVLLIPPVAERGVVSLAEDVLPANVPEQPWYKTAFFDFIDLFWSNKHINPHFSRSVPSELSGKLVDAVGTVPIWCYIAKPKLPKCFNVFRVGWAVLMNCNEERIVCSTSKVIYHRCQISKFKGRFINIPFFFFEVYRQSSTFLANEDFDVIDSSIGAPLSSLRGNLCSIGALSQEDGLPSQKANSEKSPKDANNGSPQIAAVKRVGSWIIGVSLFLVMCWSAFHEDTGYLVLLLLCYCSSVFIPGCSFCTWEGWCDVLK